MSFFETGTTPMPNSKPVFDIDPIFARSLLKEKGGTGTSYS